MSVVEIIGKSYWSFKLTISCTHHTNTVTIGLDITQLYSFEAPFTINNTRELNLTLHIETLLEFAS